MWHRKPFSLWNQFRYLLLFFLGLFLPPNVEDGLDVSSDLCNRFRIVDSPAVFIMNLFLILDVRNIPPHVFLYFWVYWSTIFVRESGES